MAQLHFYVSDDIAKKIQNKAEQAHLPVSRYLAELVKRETGQQWPDGYFEQVFETGDPEHLKRTAQGKLETREILES